MLRGKQPLCVKVGHSWLHFLTILVSLVCKTKSKYFFLTLTIIKQLIKVENICFSDEKQQIGGYQIIYPLVLCESSLRLCKHLFVYFYISKKVLKSILRFILIYCQTRRSWRKCWMQKLYFWGTAPSCGHTRLIVITYVYGKILTPSESYCSEGFHIRWHNFCIL